MNHRVSVLIVGAGSTGLGTAIRLLENGIDDFVILERGDEIGGTWRYNIRPDAACDIPTVERHDPLRHIRFGVNVTAMNFDGDSGTWKVNTDRSGTFSARAVVQAAGPLADVSWPEIRGLDTYAGHKMHSARWDHDYDMTGKRVAVIGTGFSAVQIIPELVKTAAKVKVFQRTPGWVLPKIGVPHPGWVTDLFRRVPAAQNLARQTRYWSHEVAGVGMVWDTPVSTVIQWISKANLRRQIRDPWTRRQLTPDFRAGRKTVLMTSDYYPALAKDNCKLITWPIATISPSGIRTADGIEHEVDCIVFATGFDAGNVGAPFAVTGLDGRRLDDEWSSGAHAYKGVSVPGYPNLFLMLGRNSRPGHDRMEAQIDCVVTALRLKKLGVNGFEKNLARRPDRTARRRPRMTTARQLSR